MPDDPSQTERLSPGSLPDADPLVGSRLGPCRLTALVGRGGMGAVYRGRHLALERDVAVKILAAEGDAARASSLAEARAAAKLDDPRIVAIHEVGEDAGRPYIVMQWIEGESLEARVARAGPLTSEQALAVMRETLGALAVAHEAGLVHRDVKPANILLPVKGGAKLADFGLAVSQGGGTDGDPVGTFLFMAPEQGYGHAADARADLYAVGGTWYYALTGRPPFGVNSTQAVMRHRDEAPPDAAAARGGVSRRNADLIIRLLAKQPEDRPASAAAVLKECSEYGFLLETAASLGQGPFQLLAAAVSAGPAQTPPVAPVPARLPPPPPPAPPPPRGSRVVFIAILTVFAVVAAAGNMSRTSAQDWLAASAALGLAVAALTGGERLQAWRKLAGPTVWLLSLLCAGRYAGLSVASIEAMAAAGLGAACGAAAVYLGLWGQDRQEALWARALSPLGTLLLVAAALTWGAPETQGWGAALAERSGEAWRVFRATGGPWRWLGALVFTAALVVAAKLKASPSSSNPTDRKLNWNR